MSRNTRDDVVKAASRLFSQHGYHGTSMRELGRELGLLGSSLYAHVDGKQDLLVAVVEQGAALFQAAAQRALAAEGTAHDRLRGLIAGHVEVVLDNQAEVRTFLNEARALDQPHRRRVIDARDRYEAAFRTVLREGIADGSFRPDLDVELTAIFILSILNALERWYRQPGRIDREELVERISAFAVAGISHPARTTSPAGSERR